VLAVGFFLVAAVGVWVVLRELESPDPWAGVVRLLALGAAIAVVGVDAPAAALLVVMVVLARAREPRLADRFAEFAASARGPVDAYEDSTPA
jgi:hypothetical protein